MAVGRGRRRDVRPGSAADGGGGESFPQTLSRGGAVLLFMAPLPSPVLDRLTTGLQQAHAGLAAQWLALGPNPPTLSYVIDLHPDGDHTLSCRLVQQGSQLEL